MNHKIQDDQTDFLFDAILQLKDRNECYRFFTDLCTVQELKAMSQRMTVACLLKEGLCYNEIAAKTGASTATISRVKRSLDYGNEGYDRALERLAEKQA